MCFSSTSKTLLVIMIYVVHGHDHAASELITARIINFVVMGGLCMGGAYEEKMERPHFSDLALGQTRDKGVFLVLLGTSGSGKSTLKKQMNLLYGKGFSRDERLGHRSIIFEV